ncbi:MAG TPA: anti-sigma factor [Humibacillus xanthopallidus]|nr:anti-sigma factor [Humibacillus xanthopallidus]
MSHPTEDELVDLAIGDTVAPSVSAHVERCDACASTVAELRRTARLVATAPPYAAWQAPGADVWGRITEQLGSDDLVTDELMTDEPPASAPRTGDLSSGDPVVGGLPPAGPPRPAPTPVTPPATEPSEAEPATPHTGDELERRRTRRDGGAEGARGRRLSIGWGAGLAAASLAIGLLAGRAIWQPDSPVQPVSQVALSTLDTKQDEGKATVVRSGDGLDLTVATTKPLDAGDGYLEVWLLNKDGKRMVSVGVLAPGDKASFPISQTLIDQGYVIVDISKEQFDGSPAHSGDSLLRGRLPA